MRDARPGSLIVGDSGIYYYSDDSGNSWSFQTLNSGRDLNALIFADALMGVRLSLGKKFFTQPGGGDQFQFVGGLVTQAQSARFDLHDINHLVNDQLDYLI